MNTATVRELQHEFDEISQRYVRLGRERSWREARAIVAWLAPGRLDRVLDAACGPASLVRAIKGRVRATHALDLSFAMVKTARALARRGRRQIEFVLGDIERLPYPDACFDLILCSYVFADLAEPRRALSEFRRVTRPRGRIVICEVLAPQDPQKQLRLNQLEAARGRAYARIRSRAEFEELFRRSRLELEQVRTHRSRRHLDEWMRTSPAAADSSGRRKLRDLMLDSIPRDKAGLNPRQSGDDVAFSHETAWFLLSLRG
jgi:ubiquinone/menaquinone biosynthesis C-methylase UbiE